MPNTARLLDTLSKISILIGSIFFATFFVLAYYAMRNYNTFLFWWMLGLFIITLLLLITGFILRQISNFH